MSRTPLSISKLQDLRLKAIDGTTVIDKYNLLQSLLERELPEGSPSILSEPEFIQREGVVKWYPPIPGEARPFDELTPEEKTKAISLLDENIENLKELAAKLAKSQSANRIYAGKCVEQIVETRDSFKLFMVGDRLIATNWGADAQDGDATRMSGELTEGTGTFLAAPPPVPKAPIQPISQGPTWQQPLTPPPPVGLIPRRRGCLFFLGPLLALLLPLLLLFLLLWFLKLLPWMVPLPQVDLEAQRGLQDKLFSLRDRYSEELEACPIPRDPGAPQAPLTQEGKPLEIPDDDDTLVARGGGSYAGDGTVVDGAPAGELPTAQEDAKVEGDPPLDTPEEPKAPETPPEEPLAPETPPETPEEPKAETPPEPPKSEEPTGMPQPTPDSENNNDGDPLNMP
ncbi:MAG: hypothetical protein LBE27_05705, partial [Deltaproteobacteria bacterium]|nr:hypothetical protein [Deltaproteobacteria bacterium]